MPIIRTASFALLVLLALAGPSPAAPPLQMTMQALVRGKQIEGSPLAWSNENVILLGRDGAMIEFAPAEAQGFQKTSESFSPYSQSVLRGMLEREFGSKFEVTGTGHFLVVHPKGQKQWADRFEQMYRSCIMYFQVRGFAIGNPDFPLVAIVFANQDDFRRYSLEHGMPAGAGLLGYYSPQTNRVALYDLGEGRVANKAQSQENFATAVHEASHQTAFNTGIHSRWSPPPRWVAEGLGTMFEAPGVGDSRSFPAEKDRINRGRLNDFKQLLAKRKTAAFVELINSDRQFDRDTVASYAEAWAFTFFLVEKMPREYAKYLAKTASRPPFAPYTSAQRLKDFTDVFGENMLLLDARLLRFINELRS